MLTEHSGGKSGEAAAVRRGDGEGEMGRSGDPIEGAGIDSGYRDGVSVSLESPWR